VLPTRALLPCKDTTASEKYHVQREFKRVETTTLTSYENKAHYLKIKGLIQKKDITNVNTETANTGGLEYIWPILTELKGEENCMTGTVGDHNTLHPAMGGLSTQKISKETLLQTAL
jgi:hypothetical protein